MKNRTGTGRCVVAIGMGLLAATSAARAGDLISQSSTGERGNEWSREGSISADGRFVAFASLSSNLVGGDTNTRRDIFVRDRETSQTERVSLGAGGAQAVGHSANPAISPDGRFVAFESKARNLVANDTNGNWDIFLRDRQGQQTFRISVSPAGTQANEDCFNPAVSVFGRFVAFDTESTSLIDDDENDVADVYLRDRLMGTTERVSVSSDGVEGDGASANAAISSDGRFVAFESDATNLVPSDGNGMSDVFVHDRVTGVTERVSISTSEVEGDGESDSPSISADGRFVAFRSRAENLVPGDNNDVADIFVRDRLMGTTVRVSLTHFGSESDGLSRNPVISCDGRFVAFASVAENMVASDTNDTVDVFLRDIALGSTVRVSVSSDDSQVPQGGDAPAISGEGRFVVWESGDSGIDGGTDENDADDIFFFNRTQLENVPPVVLAVAKTGLPEFEFYAGQEIELLVGSAVDSNNSVQRVRFLYDANGNGVADAGDELLGADTDGADGWTLDATAGETWPLGPARILAIAVDSANLQGAPTSAIFELTDTRPRADELKASPDPVGYNENLTLTLENARDPDGSIVKARFLRDLDTNGRPSAGDEFLGADTDEAGGWSLTVPVDVGWGVGQRAFVAELIDDEGQRSDALLALVETFDTTIPMIETLTPSEPFVRWGEAGTLLANGVSDGDGEVVKVRFLRDVNATGEIDAGDQIIGADNNGANGWTIAFTADEAWGDGPQTFLAQAIDDDGKRSQTVSVEVDIVDGSLPFIGTLAASPMSVRLLEDFTLTATGVGDADGSVAKVRFLRDANSTGEIDAGDEILGADSNGSNGWSFVANAASGWGIGTQTILAQAIDDEGKRSRTRTVEVTITEANKKPTVGSITAAPDPVVQGGQLTLTANQVKDADGTVTQVRFVRDTNDNGRLDEDDEQVASDTSGSGGWSASFTVDAAWGTGTLRFFAEATDNNGAKSEEKFVDVTVNPPGASLAILYVDDEAPAGGDGSGWDSALPTLSAALSASLERPGISQVWVRSGVHTPGTDPSATFALRGHLRILGGFSGTESDPAERNPLAAPTVLSGDLLGDDAQGGLSDNARRVVTVLDAADVTLDGVTISGGFDPSGRGAGVHAQASGLSLVRVVLEGNAAELGAGLFAADGADVLVLASTVRGNAAALSGAGVFADAATVRLVDTIVRDNDSMGTGGAIGAASAGLVEVHASTLAGNTAALAGGAIDLVGGSATLTNTIVFASGEVPVTLDASSAITLARTLIEGGTTAVAGAQGAQVSWGVGNIDAPPSFADGDLTPAAGSPAMDAGDGALLPADTQDLDGDGNTAEPLPVDRSGRARVVGSRPDIGAQESPDAPAPCPPDLTEDGSVDTDDFITLLGYFSTGDIRADLNDSGRVDTDDFILFMQLFAAGCN